MLYYPIYNTLYIYGFREKDLNNMNKVRFFKTYDFNKLSSFKTYKIFYNNIIKTQKTNLIKCFIPNITRLCFIQGYYFLFNKHKTNNMNQNNLFNILSCFCLTKISILNSRLINKNNISNILVMNIKKSLYNKQLLYRIIF